MRGVRNTAYPRQPSDAAARLDFVSREWVDAGTSCSSTAMLLGRAGAVGSPSTVPGAGLGQRSACILHCSHQIVRRGPPSVSPRGENGRGMVRDQISGGEMRYILAIFVGILLLIFGVFGGLLDLIF